jgi:hypothetical protein
MHYDPSMEHHMSKAGRGSYDSSTYDSPADAGGAARSYYRSEGYYGQYQHQHRPHTGSNSHKNHHQRAADRPDRDSEGKYRGKELEGHHEPYYIHDSYDNMPYRDGPDGEPWYGRSPYGGSFGGHFGDSSGVFYICSPGQQY